MSTLPKNVYSLSGVPGAGKSTRGYELEKKYGWKFYPEPTEEWPLKEFYKMQALYKKGEATNEDMMDATNYLQLRIGISYLRLGAEINEFMKNNPGVIVVVERSPFDTTLFLRTNTIPQHLRPIQIEQYNALKDFMSMYNRIEPWCNVHHIFLKCAIPEVMNRLRSRDETRITEDYLRKLHVVHVEAFPEEDRNMTLKSSTYIGDDSVYSVIDITEVGVSETCALICEIREKHGSRRDF